MKKLLVLKTYTRYWKQIYKKGKAVAWDECISDKQTEPYQKLTKEMQKEMKAKADKLFKE